MNRILSYCRDKSFLLFISFFAATVNLYGQANNPDLPAGTTVSQTAPVGTIVIAMDNINQACSVIHPGTGTYLFNLRAYGLAIFLGNLDYNLQWAIKDNKAHDDIDFTATAERITPSYIAPQSYDFRAGPMLIFPSDTTDIVGAIDWFNNWQGPDSSKVNVYRLTAPASVEVRYSLTNRVRAALYLDTCDIHRNFMEMASVPFINYDCVPNATTLRSGCYTIITDPHTTPGQVPPADYDSILNFVMAGGNFLSECEGVRTFEERMKYHSVTGAVIKGAGGQCNSSVVYPNADMAYGQFHGIFRPRTRGVLQNWRYESGNINNWYRVVGCDYNNTSWMGADATKLTSDTGSMVFYLGNHEYVTHDCHEPTCITNNFTEYEINGIRVYLNAVLVPSKVLSCIMEVPLAVQLNEFIAFKKNEAVLLEWTSLEEEDNTVYFIEHSTNGRNFSFIGQLEGIAMAGHDYEFLHTNPITGINYYRLRMISTLGKTTYSEIRKVVFGNKDQTLNIYPNPAKGTVNILLDVKDGERLQINIYDEVGRLAKQNQVIIRNQRAELNSSGLHNGIYWIIASAKNGEQYKAKLQIIQ